MSRISREQALERFRLSYELTVHRDRETIYRTMAIGILADVLRDASQLAIALGGDRLSYVRQAQRVPPAPDYGTTLGPWHVGEQIERGIPSELRLERPRDTARPAGAIL